MVLARSDIHWLTEAGMFFEQRGPVWETLRDVDRRFVAANIDYVVIGGLALNIHKYPRQTIDLDVVLNEADFKTFLTTFVGKDFEQVKELPRRFVSKATGVTVDFLLAGQLAGDTQRNKVIRFPDPTKAEIHDDIRTIPLAKLIELKLVTWRFKDWGDVVELIRRNQLTEDFADQLDPSVRTAYKECFDQANDPNYEAQ
jgi:hypothetical protein